MNLTKEIVMKKWQKEIACNLVASVVREAFFERKNLSRKETKKIAKTAAKAAVLGMRKINAASRSGF